MSLTTAVSDEDDGESVMASPYKAKATGTAAASFNCTGAVRKAGWDTIFYFLFLFHFIVPWYVPHTYYVGHEFSFNSVDYIAILCLSDFISILPSHVVQKLQIKHAEIHVSECFSEEKIATSSLACIEFVCMVYIFISCLLPEYMSYLLG